MKSAATTAFRSRTHACHTCPTPCANPPFTSFNATCPLPVPRWKPVTRESMGLGDVVEIVSKPFARFLKLGCLDERGHLKPESACAKRKALLNQFSL